MSLLIGPMLTKRSVGDSSEMTALRLIAKINNLTSLIFEPNLCILISEYCHLTGTY